uniref:SUZ RNA-binding domain-containing n=1 Tax=Strigamia maritima TaxID=126957 RepID=T1JL21_STRMM
MADDNDDDVCDSWEDMLDNNVLEEHLKKITPLTIPDDEKIELSCGQNVYVGPMILHEDTGRTPYSPPEPQVKILKRPTNSAHHHHDTNCGATATNTPTLMKNVTLVNSMQTNALVNGERMTKQPVKSLQQREAEYAEARLRILGSAKSEEEIAEERLAKLGLNSHPEIAIRGLHLSQHDQSSNNVLRQPRGPDGTLGFCLKR